MRAIAVHVDGALGLVEVPEPELHSDEALVRMTSVGVCATDREMIRTGTIFTMPPGEDQLILGHEGLGRIEHVGAGVDGLSPGDVVVPVAYRRCEPMQLACRVDLCPYGKDRRAGINSHGFFSEFVTRPAEYLVKVPDEVATTAMLLEPLTVSLKGMTDANMLRQRWLDLPCHYRPAELRTRALIIGIGPIGMLGVFVARSFGWDTVAVDIVPDGSPKAALVGRVGATYVDGREHTPEAIRTRFDEFDVIVEAVQAPRALIDYADILAPNGVFVILGWSGGSEMVTFDLARFVRDVLLTKQASIVASTGAGTPHYIEGAQILASVTQQYGDVLSQLITHRYPAQDFAGAFQTTGPDQIKAVIDF
jgi:threonine dehydrogenase-like Zn-dependent dehydrogenase